MYSILGDLEERSDLVEDFSDLEEEFLLEAPVTEWVECPESRRPQRPCPWDSQHREEQEALRRLDLLWRDSSLSKVS